MSIRKRSLPGIHTDEIAKARLPLPSGYTLPRAAYTSKEIYALECEHILRKSWLPIARIDQVPEHGSYLTLDLLGQPVMVVHGADDEIRVMSSVCLHRGAPIAQGSGKRNVFTCPYHAWSYDTTGQLRRAPLMEGAEDFTENAHRLPQIRSEVWEGFILANLDPDAQPLAPQIAAFTDYFKNFQMGDMFVAKTLTFDSGWNWKVLVENFMEAYHHIAIHSTTFEPVFHARDSRVPDNTGPWSILHMPAAFEEMPPGSATIAGLEDWQAKDLFASVIFPHFMLGIHGQGAAWYQVIPAAANHLTLKIHLMMPKSAAEHADFESMVAEMAESVSAIHQEDIEANDLVWVGLNAPMTEQGRLSPLEKSIWQLNQWWLDKMLGHD
ncbi:cntA [Symbiodinium necroappetens]|jgi:phenylpropionate dioxygenase-like ring-hydroxylating dioxygenase large terminal subunit|uniref:Choline monooxygenase, chloroplastic n=1 Tax=Symbiodinium necroappetens TaxID=1628268 RepID=A0A812IKZ4_9DINO|nr:aromatic ring-hydroxylating dioxygenase subunit alpha [Pseudomonadales bacterium]CAE7149391.1 cntA [Symbiodinium necroappetens]